MHHAHRTTAPRVGHARQDHLPNRGQRSRSCQWTIQRAMSEEAAALACEVLELLLDLAVCEDVLDMNPMGSVAREGGPTRLGGLEAYRRLVSRRLEFHRARRREAGEAD